MTRYSHRPILASILVVAAPAVAFALAQRAGVAGQDTAAWSPDGVSPGAVSVASVLQPGVGVRRAGFVAEERFLLRVGDDNFAVDAVSDGVDYRIDANLGAHYAMGRSGSQRWRETPAGTVRIIESDVQGDDLDRWPDAVLGFDRTRCQGTGSTADSWVLRCTGSDQVPHWLFISKANDEVRRETVREGSRVFTFSFDDFRPSPLGPIPYHWTISGSGGDADVTLQSIAARSGTADFSVPPSSGEIFALPAGVERIRVPAQISRGSGILLPLSLNGHTMDVSLDTGTTQVLMDVGEAARIGLRGPLDHVIAQRVRIGDLRASSLPIETVNLFGGRLSAIVGYEFFTGHIVHIDLAGGLVEVIRRSAFTPPSGAVALAANCEEGMPLVAMGLDDTIRNRVALDTGSQTVVLSPSYGKDPDVAWPSFHRARYMNFLEGPLLVRAGGVGVFRIGPFRMVQTPVNVVLPDRNSLSIPLDGIIGMQVLSRFELWFDYDANQVWLRPFT